MASNGWREVTLGNLLKIKHGYPFKSELFSEELTGRPIVVAVGNFQYTGGFRFESTAVKEYCGDYPKEFELEPGDVLLVMTCQTAGGEILGIPGRIPDDGRVYLHNQRLGKVIVNRPDLTTIDYLYWLFLWRDFNQELVASSSGTKIVHTAPSRIEAFKFALPPLDEQRAIARILGALDDKIELNRRMNRTLEALTQALFKSWFVDFDPVTAKAAGRKPYGMNEETSALFPERFVETELSLIPEGWRVGSLSEIANINARKIDEKFSYKTIEYVDISSVSCGNLEGTTQLKMENAPSRAQRLVSHGDTIWSCVRPNRKSYLLIQHPASNIVASTGFAVLSPKGRYATYLYLWVTTDEFTDYLTANAEGSAYPAVRPEIFASARVLVPSPNVLKVFESRVSSLFELREQNRSQSNTLASIRDALLPKLLSGEIRVRQAENLVAEVV